MYSWPATTTGAILSRVNDERHRQEELCRAGKFPHTCASADPSHRPSDRLAILAEEFGEVARHVTEGLIDERRLDRSKLQQELIEVAAVAVAWAESLQ